ncbi:MAG TPA: hypothetical protein VFT53_03215 [Candidatus Saccharimonadales bacterium]|nr:hypothetical protein [Candidatus Saccharimonadales bacterium]
MLRNVLHSRVFVLFGFSVLSIVTLAGGIVHADASPAARPVTVAAICSDVAAGTAQWRIGNPNPDSMTTNVQWSDGTHSGTIALKYGFTPLTTQYDAASAAPSVTFTQAGLPDQTVAVSTTSCTEPVEGCVDGYVRSNLQFTWSQTGVVTISTVNNAPLCADVTVDFSSYSLPGTYDGSGVFDDSAVPQQLFANTEAVLKQGTTGSQTLTVSVPNACTDYQLDLYYAPEVTTVSYGGQGAQLIYGKIYLHTATTCSATPGRGAGDVTPTTPTVPAVTTQATLADTGASALVPTAGALMLAAAAAATNFSAIAKVRRLFVR